jgi:hypothetical protein
MFGNFSLVLVSRRMRYRGIVFVVCHHNEVAGGIAF